MQKPILRIDWYFDLVSPFAYLQFQNFGRLPEELTITPKPVLLGAILKHWGQLGPAEIAPKRLHTYRICQWLATERGVPFRMPARHPFNPLKADRLLCALGPDLETVRRAFGFVFVEGRAADTDEEFATFGEHLGVSNALERASTPEAKDKLRENTEEAIVRGVFGVPTFHIDDENFWGDDATGMLLAYFGDRTIFSRGEMARLADLPVGVRRDSIPA